MATVRPPSATIRKSTSSGQNINITPLNTNIKLGSRPITQQGIDSNTRLKTGINNINKDRQIADKTYYLTLLRNKISDITKESNSLKNEIEKLTRDSNTYNILERKYNERINEVRLLEGQLADYNLTFDKIRTHTEISEIKNLLDRLTNSNEIERTSLDEIFMSRA